MVAIRNIIGDSDSLGCLLGVRDSATSVESTDPATSVESTDPATSVDSSVVLGVTSFVASSWEEKEEEEEEEEVEAGGS